MTLHRINRKRRTAAARIAASAALIIAGAALGISHATAAPGVFDGGTLLSALLLAAGIYAAARKEAAR